MRESFIESKQLLTPKNECISNIKINIFASPIYTFSLAGNINVYTRFQVNYREKYFIHSNYKGKMPTLAGNKHLSDHLFVHRPSLLHLSTEKTPV